MHRLFLTIIIAAAWLDAYGQLSLRKWAQGIPYRITSVAFLRFGGVRYSTVAFFL